MKKTLNSKIKTIKIEALRAQANDARRALVGLSAKGLKQVERHPVGAVVGAFATGMAVAKLVGRS
jgi:hypothetical protein